MTRAALLLTVFLFVFLPLQGASDRIHKRLDPTRTVLLKGHRHPAAIAQNDVGPAAADLAMEYVTILMKPGPGLDVFLTEQQSSASPNYHRWLTPEQYGERFGLSESDLKQVTAWLRSQNLRVNDVARGRHWITFSGTAGQIGKAFRTEIRRYRVNGQLHLANATEPSVPEAFEGVVAGFDRLNDFEEHHAHVHANQMALDLPAFNSGSAHYLAPDDLATIYNLTGLYAAGIDGTGQKIAVIGQTDISLTDVRNFRRRFNLPANDPQVVLVGPDPGIRTGDIDEAHLDLEWTGAAARNATIVYVNSTSVRTSVQYAIDQNLAPVISYSYGSCELLNSMALRQLAQQANAQGITWVVASGDVGSATCDTAVLTPQSAKGPTLSWPASAPEVTAIGGTTFNENGARYWASTADSNGASALSYIPEKVWNDSDLSLGFGSSAGSGASAFFLKPFWQTGPGVPNDNARDIPDISLSASAAHDGYLVVTGGGLFAIGGTSAGAPYFAGVLALLNHYLVSRQILAQPGLGNVNPTLYRMAQATPAAFHDVVDGDNKTACVQSSPGCIDGRVGFSAGPGYDLASGLGSIDAFQLISNWDAGHTSRTLMTVNPATVSANATVELTATVAGDAGTPTGSIVFLANDTQIGTAALKASGGAASATLAIPGTLALAGTAGISALYSGDSVYGASAATAAVTPAASTGSLVIASVSPNPVYQTSATGWSFTVSLTERNGVATKVTGFTLGGSDGLSLLGDGNIPANGTLSASLVLSLNSGNQDLLLILTGIDADGRQWSQQLMVHFAGPAGRLLYPAMSVSSTPKVVQQSSDASCPWRQEITVQEQNGYWVQLTQMSAGGNIIDSQIQHFFGTTRLAPYGSLHGTLCLSNVAAPQSRSIQIRGVAENGQAVTASLSVNYQAAPPNAPTMDLSVSEIKLALPDSHGTASSNVKILFGGTGLPWTATVLPGNRTTTWLNATPSGTGSATLTVDAAGTGLSNGVYRASIAVEAPGATPQSVIIPVTLVVGGSPNISIVGAANGASFQPVFAPGMLASVFGTGLAPGTQKSATLPLPLQAMGVSATVNGISAPLYYASPEQLNIQIPYEAGAGAAVLAVNNNGQIASFPFRISVTAPGLFGIWDATGVPAASAQLGQTLIAFMTGEGDEAPVLATGAAVPSGTPLSRLPVPRLPVTVTVGGVQATVAFAGIPNSLVGITQINFTVPASVAVGPQDVVVTVDGVATQSIKLNVTAP